MNRRSLSVQFLSCSLLLLFIVLDIGAASEAPRTSVQPPQKKSWQDPSRDENWLQQKIREYRTYPHLDRAYRLMDAGKLDQAKLELEKYLSIDPNDATVRTTYFMLLNRMKNYPGVVDQTTILLKSRPEATTALLYRAMAYESLHRSDDAIRDYKAVLLLPQVNQKDRSFALSSLVNLDLARRNYREAFESIQLLVKMEPSFNNLYRQGVIQENLGDHKSARQSYESALLNASTPEDRSMIYESIGEVAIKTRDLPEAQKAFAAVQNLHPQDPELLRKLARLASDQKNYPDAIQWIQKAIELKPVPKDHEFLANVFFTMKNYEGAAREFNLALASNENDENRYHIYVALGNTYAQWKKYDQAADMYGKASKLRKDSSALRDARSDAETAGSRADFTGGFPYRGFLRSGDCLEQQTLANLDARLSRPQEALGAFDQAIEMGCDGPEIRKSMGLAYFSLNQWQPALENFQRSFEANRDPQTALYLAAVYAKLNRSDESIRVLESVRNNAGLLPPEEQATFYSQLGYLYSVQPDLVRSSDAYGRSLALHYDPEIAVRRGHVQYALGETKESEKTFAQIDPASLSQDSRDERFSHLSEIGQKNDPLSINAYMAFRSNSLPQASVAGGSLPSQGGVEFAYQPVKLPGEKRLEVFTRILWAAEPQSVRPDAESYQGGIGVRLKPLNSVNLVFSGERLLKIGDHAMDSWLVRSTYSWDSGYALKPGIRRWNYTLLYADSGYFTANHSWGSYAELRRGVSWNLNDGWVFTPHALADFRSEIPSRLNSSYLEAGGGLSIRYQFHKGPYHIPGSTMEFVVQYKRGIFANSGAQNQRFGGWVFTTVLGV